MANITKEIAALQEELTKLSEELDMAIDKGDQEAIDKIQKRIDGIRTSLKELQRIPSAEDISNGNFHYLDDKTPNALHIDQINMRGLSADDVSKFPVWIVDEDTQDVYEVPLSVAFGRERSDDLEDTKAEYLNSHKDVRAMYVLVRAATKFVAVDDQISDDYGWALTPWAGYTFKSDEKHSSEQGLTSSQYNEDRYFPKGMLSTQGFKVSVNGKESLEGSDYNFDGGGIIKVSGHPVVRFITFAGGYTINDGDNVTCSGYKFSDTEAELDQQIKLVTTHGEDINTSYESFKSGNLASEETIKEFIKEQAKLIKSREEVLEKLLYEENEALANMDAATNEKDAKLFRNTARVKSEGSLTPLNDVDQASAEVENGENQIAQLAKALSTAGKIKSVWDDETSQALIGSLKEIKNDIAIFYADEKDPNDEEVGPM